MKRSPILLLAVPVLILCGVFLIVQWTSGPSPVPMKDFVEYWSAGKSFTSGGNPYDPKTLLALQQQALEDPELKQAMMMWNPPWALPLVAPLGAMPPRIAHPVWLFVQFLCVAVSVAMLLAVCNIPFSKSMPVVVACLLFTPFHLLFWYGQVGGFCLLGLAGYLYFARRQSDYFAGAMAALTALKPHLLFLFGILLIADAVRTKRGRRVLAGGIAAIIGASLLAAVINPNVYQYYIESITAPPSDAHENVRTWAAPLISYQFRIAIDPQVFSIQFIPTIIVSMVLLAICIRKPVPPDDLKTMSAVVFASTILATYGSWIFDLIVLLVPVVHAASVMVKTAVRSRMIYVIIAVYILLSLLSTFAPIIAAQFNGKGFALHWYIYFSPAVAALYYLTLKQGADHGR